MEKEEEDDERTGEVTAETRQSPDRETVTDLERSMRQLGIAPQVTPDSDYV